MNRFSAKIRPAFMLVAALLAVCPVCYAAGSKADMLFRLTQPGRSIAISRASTAAAQSPSDAGQLALDLIFYRWACASCGMPSDVPTASSFVPAIASQLNDRTIDWAARYFSTDASEKTETPLPVRDDPRVQDLFDLKTQFRSALDYKESSPLKAAASLQNAARLCQKLYLDLSEAVVLKLLGDHYSYDMARYPAAEACYERAAWTLSAYRCSASSATVYDDWGTLSARSGRYANATEQFTEAARQWELLARQDPSRYKYRDRAGIEYMRAGEARMAAGDTAAGLELMRVKGIGQLQTWAGATKSYDLLITYLIKVAEIRRRLGDAADSLELLKQAKRACEQQSDPLVKARVYGELAQTYTALDQRSYAPMAIAKKTHILKAAAEAGEPALAKLAKTSSGSAEEREVYNTAECAARAYESLGNLPKSADIWRRVASAYQRSGAVAEQIRCLRALGSVLETAEKPKDSLDVRREAVVLARASNLNSVAADIVQEMVQAFISEGNIPNALEAFTELTPIIEEAGNIRGAARVLEARARLLVETGDYESAAADFRNARMRYISQIGDAWAAGQVALELARAQQISKQRDEARATLETAIEDIENSYSDEAATSDTDDIRSQIVIQLYQETGRLLVRDGAQDAATELFGKARKYPWLARTVAEMRNDQSDPEVARWAKSIDVILPDGVFPGTDNPGERVMGDNWGGFAESCWWLEKQFPREYSSLPVDPLVMLKSRNLLPEGFLAVAYLPTESSLYVFVCGRDLSICRQVSVRRSTIEAEVSKLRRTLRNCEESISVGIPIPPIVHWQESSFLEIKEPLVALYTHLFAPIREDLGACRHLGFILPSEFAGLPIHALIAPESNGAPRFLIQQYAVSYVSRGMLDSLVSQTNTTLNPATDSVSIFADPENNLPGAQKEAANVKSAYAASRWFVGRDRATATNLLTEIKRGEIIHIAAHHRIDPNPSGFQLLLGADKDSSGLVGVRELSAIESPNLKLVVLSACDSIGSADPISSGPAHAAEVFSLAGAQSVLGGLWKVSDEAASKLMGDFYRALSRGKSRSEALQSALLSVIESKQYAHPFYWACFALYGNPR